MKSMIHTALTLILLISSSVNASDYEYVSAQNGKILNYSENKVLCEVVLNTGSGETTLGFIKKYALKLESNDTKEFLLKFGTSIECYGRSFIYFLLYKGHLDDIVALFNAGYDVNWIIEDTRGRRMTMLDYLWILYHEEANSIYKDLIRTKILTVRRQRGKTCEQLKYDYCSF